MMDYSFPRQKIKRSLMDMIKSKIRSKKYKKILSEIRSIDKKITFLQKKKVYYWELHNRI